MPPTCACSASAAWRAIRVSRARWRVRTLGAGGAPFLRAAMAFSALGVCAVTIIATPWMYVAMAREGLFFARFARLNEKTGAPILALAVQAALCLAYWFWGQAGAARVALLPKDSIEARSILTPEVLTSAVVYIEWVFHACVALALLRLRATRPNLPRPFRSPLYPLAPGAVPRVRDRSRVRQLRSGQRARHVDRPRRARVRHADLRSLAAFGRTLIARQGGADRHAHRSRARRGRSQRERRGSVVVIDVLRAFTTAAYAFAAGAREILLTSTVEEAFALRARLPARRARSARSVASRSRASITATRRPRARSRSRPRDGDPALEQRNARRRARGVGAIDLARQPGRRLGHGARARARALAADHSARDGLHLTTREVTPERPADDDGAEDDACADILEDLLRGRAVDRAAVVDRVLASTAARQALDPAIDWITPRTSSARSTSIASTSRCPRARERTVDRARGSGARG